MSISSFMHGWLALLGSLATIALILTAFALMLGILKPADAPKRVAAILCAVALLILILGVLVIAWSDLSLWQQIALVTIGIAVWQWRRPRRPMQRK
jgi:hypothetical protein